MRKFLARGLFALALAALVASAFVGVATAQLPTATILGVVRDSSGAVIPGVALTTRNTETGQARETVSGSNGEYRFAALPVGSYEVRAEIGRAHV